MSSFEAYESSHLHFKALDRRSNRSMRRSSDAKAAAHGAEPADNALDRLSQRTAGNGDTAAKRCTPSGFCISTPGKFLAADAFGLKLLPGNSKDFEAETPEGEPVQIRSSGKGSFIPIYGGRGLLLVVKIRETTIQLIYGGPAINAWNAAREPNHRGVRTISLTTLKMLYADLPQVLRMKKRDHSPA